MIVVRLLLAIGILVGLALGPNWCQPCEDPSQIICEKGASSSTRRV